MERTYRKINSSQKGFENIAEGTKYDDYHIDTNGMGILSVENIIEEIEGRGNQAVLTVQTSSGSTNHSQFSSKDWKEYKDSVNNAGNAITDVWVTEVEGGSYVRNSRRPIKSGKYYIEYYAGGTDNGYVSYDNDATIDLDNAMIFDSEEEAINWKDEHDDEWQADLKVVPYPDFDSIESSRRPVKSSVRWSNDDYIVETFEEYGNGEFYVSDKETDGRRFCKTFWSEKDAVEWAKNNPLKKVNSSRQIKSSITEDIKALQHQMFIASYEDYQKCLKAAENNGVNVDNDISVEEWEFLLMTKPSLRYEIEKIIEYPSWYVKSSRQIKSSFPRTTKELADWINKNSRHRVQYREPFDDFVFKENATSFRVDGDEVVMEGHGYSDSEPLTVYINQFKADPSYIRSARYIATDPESGEVLGSADPYEEAVNEWGEDVTITDSEAAEGQEEGELFQSRKSIKSDLNVNDEAAYWDGVEDGVNGLPPADEDDPDYMKGWKVGKARLKSMNIHDYNVNSSRRPIKSSLQTEVVENFPEYMVNYAVYGERLDVTDEDVSLYEEWRERNGYGTCFGTGSVYDESYFSNHPAFGLPCTVIPVVFEVSNGVTSFKKPETTKQFMTRILSELEEGKITEDEAAEEIAEANDVNIGYAKQILSNYIADKDRYITSGMLELGEALNMEFNPDGNLDSWSVDFVSDPEKAAPTLGGELVRAARYIIAAFRDSGEKIGWGYAKEMLNPAARFIVENTDFTGNDTINDMVEGNVPDDESYRKWIDEFEVEFSDYLRDHEDYFHKLNRKDFTEGKNEGDSFSSVKELLISDDEGNDYFFEYIDGQFVCTGVDEGTSPEYIEGDVITAEDYMFDNINFDEEFGEFEQDGFIYSWEDGNGESVTISDVSLKNPMFWYDDILTEEEIANLIENGVKIYDPSKGTSDTDRRELKISDIM